MGPGRRPKLGQRRLLAGQLGRAWCCDHRRQQRGHLGVPRGRLVGGRSPSRSRSARSSSSASGSGSGVNGSRLISADQASSAPMGYTALRARGPSWSAPSRWASRRSPRWVRTRTVFGRLSMISATCLTSSPATTRSTTASAWPAGRVAIRASAARSSRAPGRWRPGRRAPAVRAGWSLALLDWLAGGPTPPVPGLVPGDGEHPGPERRLVALESADRPDHRKPGFRCQVLGGFRSDHTEIAHQPGLQVVPQHPEGVLVATSSTREHRWEAEADHRHRRCQESPVLLGWAGIQRR